MLQVKLVWFNITFRRGLRRRLPKMQPRGPTPLAAPDWPDFLFLLQRKQKIYLWLDGIAENFLKKVLVEHKHMKYKG